MAYSTISKPGLHFNTKLYTGNGSTQLLRMVNLIWLDKTQMVQVIIIGLML